MVRWYVTIPLAVNLLVSLAWSWPINTDELKRQHFWIGLLSFIPVLVLISEALLEAPSSVIERDSWHSAVPFLFVIFHGGAGALLSYRVDAYRWLSASIVLLTVSYSFSCGIASLLATYQPFI